MHSRLEKMFHFRFSIFSQRGNYSSKALLYLKQYWLKSINHTLLRDQIHVWLQVSLTNVFRFSREDNLHDSSMKHIV